MTYNIKGYTIKIDKDDFHFVDGIKWCTNKNGNKIYFEKRINNKIKYLHRMIMDCPRGFEVDHKNGDTLDNRKCNLRICKPCENRKNAIHHKNNTSGYKGVSIHKQTGKWIAQISHDRKHISLGLYDSKENAYKAYCAGSRKYHGEYGNVK